MRATLPSKACFAAFLLTASALAWAQAAVTPPLVREEIEFNRQNQRVEHIRVEDSGSRIDELRVGGLTRSITVRPKGIAPAYDVQPASPALPGGAGQRTWKVFSF